MRLYICEKAKAAQTLAGVLGPHRHIAASKTTRFAGHKQGDKWRVAYLSGHFYELLSPQDVDSSLSQWRLADLPIIQRNLGWKPIAASDMVPVDEVHKQIEHIKSLYDTTDEVVLATDGGQEGQVIGQVFLQETGWAGPVLRLWTGVWTQEGLTKALSSLRPNGEFQGYFEAGVARAIADQHIGINFTRLFTLKARCAGFNITANTGRVRSPAMAIAIDQEQASLNHQASIYYTLQSTLTADDSEVVADLTIPNALLSDGKHCFNRSAIEGIQKDLSACPHATVLSSEASVSEQPPPAPFSQNTLGQYCAEQHQMMPDETLKAAQALYESGYLSYPRTDCEIYEEEVLRDLPGTMAMLQKLSPLFEELSGLLDIRNPQPVFNDRLVNETSDHGAIYVTKNQPDLAALSVHERHVYIAVALRQLAQIASPIKTNHAKIQFQIGSHVFTAKAVQLIDSGWSAFLPHSHSTTEPLPALNRGDQLNVKAFEMLEKKTKAPPRLTIAAFQEILKDCTHLLSPTIKARVGRGQLGTGATQPGYLPGLVQQGALQILDKKYVVSTKRGRELRALLPTVITSPNMTALWELHFRAIRTRSESAADFLETVFKWIEVTIKQLKDSTFPASPTMTPCPKCRSALLRQVSKQDPDYRFWVCSNEDCDVLTPDVGGLPLELLPKDGSPCPLCQSPLKTRMSKKSPGTEGRFLRCSNKTCKYTEEK